MDIQHVDVKIKQYSQVTYLGCELDESWSGEAMTFKVINKSGLNSFTGKTSLARYLKRLLCNALIQPHFDYACSAWYPNLHKKF